MYKVLMILALGLFLTACSHTSGGIASSTIPLSPDGYRVLGEVDGSDCGYSLLGLIPLTGGNETHSALQDALEQRPKAEALIEVTSDTYFQYWVLWSNTCTQVKGRAVTIK